MEVTSWSFRPLSRLATNDPQWPGSAWICRRPRVPVPPEPKGTTALPVSNPPPALLALLEALPPEAHLPLEPLAPLVVQRTPLADATLSLWAYLLKPSVLDKIFRQHRGRSFEDILTFPTLVELIRDALVLHKGSGRQSFHVLKSKGTCRPARKPPTASCGGCRSP